MKRRNKPMRIGALVLMLTIITTTLIAVIYARYTTTIGGSGRVIGAKFNFNEAGTQQWTLSYLGAVADTGKTLDSGYMLAPGQTGQFAIGIDYYSDVEATLSLSELVVDFTGAFNPTGAANPLVTPGLSLSGLDALDATGLRFVITTDEATAVTPTDYFTDGVAASEFEDAFKLAFGTILGGTGSGDTYTLPAGTTLESTTSKIHVYWKWDESTVDGGTVAVTPPSAIELLNGEDYTIASVDAVPVAGKITAQQNADFYDTYMGYLIDVDKSVDGDSNSLDSRMIITAKVTITQVNID